MHSPSKSALELRKQTLNQMLKLNNILLDRNMHQEKSKDKKKNKNVSQIAQQQHGYSYFPNFNPKQLQTVFSQTIHTDIAQQNQIFKTSNNTNTSDISDCNDKQHSKEIAHLPHTETPQQQQSNKKTQSQNNNTGLNNNEAKHTVTSNNNQNTTTQETQQTSHRADSSNQKRINTETSSSVKTLLYNPKISNRSIQYNKLQSSNTNNTISSLNNQNIVSANSHGGGCGANMALFEQLQKKYDHLTQKVIDLITNVQEIALAQAEEKRELEFDKLVHAVYELTVYINKCSKQEIELNKKNQEANKKNQQIKQLLQKFEDINDRLKLLSNENSQLVKKILQNQESYNFLFRNFVQEKKTNEVNSRKMQQIQQRLELILDVEFPGEGQQDKLRQVLGILAKDNEKLKKELQVKEQLIKNQQDQIANQKQQINRASLRLELIKKKISAKDLEAINNEHLNNHNNASSTVAPQDQAYDVINNTLITNSQLPSKLNFRIQILKKEYANMLFDICESGASQFTTQIVNQADKTEQMDKISLLAQQFASSKDFTDNLNCIVANCLHMLTIEDLDKLFQFISESFIWIFGCMRMSLWIFDSLSGFYYTFDSVLKKEIRVLAGIKSIFKQMQKKHQPLNKRDGFRQILYYRAHNQEAQTVESCLCYPIYMNSVVALEGQTSSTFCGVLEISESKDQVFGFDEEYFGIILSKFLCQILNKMQQKRLLQVQLNYRDYLYQAFNDFTAAGSLEALYFLANDWIKKIFGVEIYNLFFEEEGKLIQYNPQNKEKRVIECNQGLIGQCYQNKRRMIVTEIYSNKFYEEHIDIYTLLPVILQPLQMKVEDTIQMLGVLEISQKKRTKVQFEKDKVYLGNTPYVGLDESYEQSLNTFTEFLSRALLYSKQKQNLN